MQIYAHRGASAYAPENTMTAFRLAKAQGAHGIEIDVQPSADGEIVVIHDEKVDRVTNGTGLVMTKTLSQLRELDISGRYDGKNIHEWIPTLSEVLELIADSDMHLNIEIKTIPMQYDAAFTKAVCDMVKRYNLVDRIILSSFDHRALVDSKAYEPSIKTGILYACYLVNVCDYALSIDADCIHPLHHCLDAQTVEQCKKFGIGVNAWTVDADADVLRMKEIGVDVVITNTPDAALALNACI